MSKRLLCVTQDPRGKRPLLHSLRSRGYDVDIATDRHEALGLSRQRTYDVALLDESVQDADGVEIARDINAQQGHVRDILCCDTPSISRVDSAIAAGLNHVVTKPFDEDQIASFVSDAPCESSRAFDERFPESTCGSRIDAGLRKGTQSFECETCGRPTVWFHDRKQTYFCSEDCLVRFR